MSRFDSERERLLQHGEEVQHRAKRSWSEFSDFALSDNVLEVAVGLM